MNARGQEKPRPWVSAKSFQCLPVHLQSPAKLDTLGQGDLGMAGVPRSQTLSKTVYVPVSAILPQGPAEAETGWGVQTELWRVRGQQAGANKSPEAITAVSEA